MTTTQKWILFAAIVIVIIIVFRKNIGGLLGISSDRNSSSEKSQSCEGIQAEAKALYSQYYKYCYTNKKDQSQCDDIINKINELQKLYTSKNCGGGPVKPFPMPPKDLIICDPKHLGYDTSGHPRGECGYKQNPGPPFQPSNPPQSPYLNCGWLKEAIKGLGMTMQHSPNAPGYQNWKKQLEFLKSQYAKLNCDGGPNPVGSM